MLEYAVILTLNGNLVLKPMEKVKEIETIEMELYGTTLEDIKAEFKNFKKENKDFY